MNSKITIWLIWFGSLFSKVFYTFIWYLHQRSAVKADNNTVGSRLVP